MTSKTESKDTTVALPELSERAQQLSAAMIKGLTADSKTGLISETGKRGDLFEQNLPEGLTMAQDTLSQDYRRDFAAGGLHAVGTLAAQAMGENKKLDSAAAEIGMNGKEELGYTVYREKTYPGIKKEGEAEATPVVKHGEVRVVYDSPVGNSSGDIKKAKVLVGALFASHQK
jgi:hypothetical protein